MKQTDPMPLPQMPEFDTEDWDQIEKAFRKAPSMKFGQFWRPDREKGFRPGTVRLGWRGDRLLYFADLSDREVVTSAKKRNDHMWALGDVFEIFTGVNGNPGYLEYHTAPNGLTLHLFFPDAGAIKRVSQSGGLGQFMRVDKKAVSRVRHTKKGWQVYGEVPASSLLAKGKAPKSMAGQVWDLSFGRYDYPASLESPILSSTSPFTKASYHRRPEWRQVVFLERESR